MPTIQINDADIYYQVYGEDRPGRAPVLLIHGSTITGEIDWSEVAPRLAQEYKVYVPDCRGHGRSSNPSGGYSFRQLASDAAAFVNAMEYERMHIIGHSNGGNVALVTLMEHPQVCQTVIPQAANAYVTDYLRVREPVVLDPDYYAAHHPQDVAVMIAAHSSLFGENYWRDLLTMTMREIIAEPNYTPAELARVECPVLSIMGGEDRVNAPDRHGQFIAEHIPHAELWVPQGIGHTVHNEIPAEWVARVLDFLKRRG
jgi:pimeloyl-ACP methyl ester carboxylesterase